MEADPHSLEFHKTASWIASDDIMTNGSKRLHYVSDLGARWRSQHALTSRADPDVHANVNVRSLDSGLMTVGPTHPFPVPGDRRAPSAEGIGWQLFNNLW